ncbi:peptidoglycan DD-metalloendopeptidase family protein [Clostridium perfringens]|uniref:phage tail spike protein n=1 Tax=Clostridium perfringens TaxID=1502 RepID=UPI0013E3A88D|nr:phage tail spike protein [Clostridium perfringens]NGT56631.1 peptidoglycan DD-metalloendopeptidase family protein [Clostridium perfringens]NGT56705.1 peptidoglycan DD-metalloendopeptidase family protein [Clostridium perfringens]NGT56779.1 peptidoglycan DD-metalloendopeptidase family protein [Clostridium perfringens]
MSIEYYKGNNTNYEFDGDVTLVPNKAIFDITMNGICEIEINHPYDKEGRWKIINGNGVIKAPTPYSKGQLFVIYSIDKNMLTTGLKIKARHIFFDLYYSTTEDIRAVNCNCQRALDILFNGTKYTGHSNIKKNNTCYFVKQNRIEAINGSNKDNTIINRWGGEIFLDNFNVYINERIGEDKGLEIIYGTNMLDLGLKENRKDIVTRIKPVAFNGRRLPELFIDSPLINKYRIVYEKYIEFSNLKFKGDLQNESEDTEDGSIIFETKEELYNALREECKKLFENGIDKPKITGNVKVAALSNTEKYKFVKDLVNINLGDTLTAKHLDLDIDIKVRCIGYKWDILKEKYIDVTIGDVVKNYFQNQSDTTQKVNSILNENGTVKSSELEGAINALKAPLLAQKSRAKKSDVVAWIQEVLDPNDPDFGCLQGGTKGILLSDERLDDNSDWNFKTAVTPKGIIADLIIGKLRTVLIQNMDASFEIDLNKPGGALFRNNGKDAILIENNMIKLFNWKKNGDYIGALTALISEGNENKPLIGLINDIDSALSLGYSKKDSDKTPSYIEFDKYNILEDKNNKPIRVYEDIDFKNRNLYSAVLSSLNDKCFIYTSNEKTIIKHEDVTIKLEKGKIILDGDVILNGVIKNTSGNTVFDPNAPIGGGADGDWQNGVMSSNCFRYLKGYEGLGRYEYRDSGGVLTIGYGVTHSEPDIYAKLKANEPVPEELAAKESYTLKINRYGKPIVNKVKALGCTTQQQFDALVDLAFNAGTGVIGANNSLMNAIRRNPTDEAYIRPIWENFYIHDDAGNRLEGLRLRRIAEANIYFQGRYEKRQIPILGRNGNPTGSVVTENNGDGWLPPRIDSTGNFKTVNNAYGNGWIIPVTGGQVTALFGHYPSGAPHSGTDFGVPIGTPVRASKSGTVIKKAELDYSYGYHLFIDHGDGLVTIYAHNSKLLVSEGQHVTAGQIIAKSGNTGNSTGPHSHIELRYNGTPVNFAPSLRIGDTV